MNMGASFKGHYQEANYDSFRRYGLTLFTSAFANLGFVS
jgi:hypothetical protein